MDGREGRVNPSRPNPFASAYLEARYNCRNQGNIVNRKISSLVP
jgi:hypothetical protein